MNVLIGFGIGVLAFVVLMVVLLPFRPKSLDERRLEDLEQIKWIEKNMN